MWVQNSFKFDLIRVRPGPNPGRLIDWTSIESQPRLIHLTVWAGWQMRNVKR